VNLASHAENNSPEKYKTNSPHNVSAPIAAASGLPEGIVTSLTTIMTGKVMATITVNRTNAAARTQITLARERVIEIPSRESCHARYTVTSCRGR